MLFVEYDMFFNLYEDATPHNIYFYCNCLIIMVVIIEKLMDQNPTT